jgi:hypothetical protein
MSSHVFRLAALSSLLVAVPALADEEAAPAEEPAAPPIAVSGFVDTSMVIPLAGYAADGDEVYLGLDQVEVDITATPTDRLTLQGDFQFLPSVGTPTVDDIVEQGYLEATLGSSGFLAAGKRNAPVGVESIDPTGLYQYSYGQLFTGATPSNLTGFFGGYRGESFSAMAWVSNDWDTPGTVRSATPGLRLEVPHGLGHVGVSSTFGPIPDKTNYLMVDVDAVIATGDLTVLAEFNFGTSEALKRIGALATINYAFADWVSATVRADWLKVDAGDVTVSDQISITAAGLFTIIDHLGAVVELRTDLPKDEDAILTAAVELLAWF